MSNFHFFTPDNGAHFVVIVRSNGTHDLMVRLDANAEHLVPANDEQKAEFYSEISEYPSEQNPLPLETHL